MKERYFRFTEAYDEDIDNNYLDEPIRICLAEMLTIEKGVERLQDTVKTLDSLIRSAKRMPNVVVSKEVKAMQKSLKEFLTYSQDYYDTLMDMEMDLVDLTSN